MGPQHILTKAEFLADWYPKHAWRLERITLDDQRWGYALGRNLVDGTFSFWCFDMFGIGRPSAKVANQAARDHMRNAVRYNFRPTTIRNRAFVNMQLSPRFAPQTFLGITQFSLQQLHDHELRQIERRQLMDRRANPAQLAIDADIWADRWIK